MRQILSLFFTILLFTGCATVTKPVTPIPCNDTSAAEGEKLDNILVWGEGFMFRVKEPPGWKADCSNAANIHANILFYKQEESFETATTLIYLLVSDKTDENVEKDLEWDMEQYRKRYPNIQFKDIPVSHPEYETYSKLFYVKGTFYEYVTYINPGESNPHKISAAMNVQREEASEEELAAYQEVIETLILFNR
jgi:hypothetical protein